LYEGRGEKVSGGACDSLSGGREGAAC